jgi:hypothetical protein
VCQHGDCFTPIAHAAVSVWRRFVRQHEDWTVSHPRRFGWNDDVSVSLRTRGRPSDATAAPRTQRSFDPGTPAAHPASSRTSLAPPAPHHTHRWSSFFAFSLSFELLRSIQRRWSRPSAPSRSSSSGCGNSRHDLCGEAGWQGLGCADSPGCQLSNASRIVGVRAEGRELRAILSRVKGRGECPSAPSRPTLVGGAGTRATALGFEVWGCEAGVARGGVGTRVRHSSNLWPRRALPDSFVAPRRNPQPTPGHPPTDTRDALEREPEVVEPLDHRPRPQPTPEHPPTDTLGRT